jgi:hypothetical protein
VIVLLPAGLAALGAVVLAVAGFAGGWVVTAAAGLCVLALAVGWGDLLRLPHRSGTSVLIGALGIGGLVAGTLAVSSHTGDSGPLSVFAAVIAAAVLASFGHELLRQDGRTDLVESITGTLSGQLVAILAAGWVLVSDSKSGASAIVVAAAAIAIARLGTAVPLPLPPAFTSWVGMALGLIAALVASLFVSDVSPLTAVIVGVAVSGVGIAMDRLVETPLSRQFDISVLARAAAPVAVAGTVAYAVVRIGIG